MVEACLEGRPQPRRAGFLGRGQAGGSGWVVAEKVRSGPDAPPRPVRTPSLITEFLRWHSFFFSFFPSGLNVSYFAFKIAGLFTFFGIGVLQRVFCHRFWPSR